ncbi:MAG: HdeD family acid-resistance protein [Candidatus Nanopelagicales bacterium]
MGTTDASPQPNGPSDGEAVTDDSLSASDKQLLADIGASWWLVLFLGIVSVIVGGVILAQPFAAVRVAALIFGIWLLVSGIFQLVQSFDRRIETTGRVLGAVSGIIGIVLGIVALKSVDNRIELLILFIGIWWIMRGIMQLIVGSGKGGSGFYVFLGLLGIFAGIVVLVWPIKSLAVLTAVAGIWLLVLGIFEVISSFMIRSAAKKAEAAA